MADLPTASTWFPTVEGLPGKSAYEIAVDEGFLGSEAQWLATLVGPTGATGPQGDPGPTGAAGVVQSVVAGTNVTVDATDPANPIVNATGGGGGGGGIASYWPSGMVMFSDMIAPWIDQPFPTAGQTIMWVEAIDSDATFTGMEYSVAVAEATAEVWFEIHTILGHGLPGTLVTSGQLVVSSIGAKTLVFTAPITLTTGMYFFSLTSVNDGAGTGRVDAYSVSTTNAETRKAALFFTDYWTALQGTVERQLIDFDQVKLPGGVFTPGADWTGVSIQVADTTNSSRQPIIGLIKQ